MDYLIADRYQVLEGTEPHYRERIIRLPDGYVCYDPPAYAPEVGPLPARETGHVTFGGFNSPAKVNAEVVVLWAEILKRLPSARLFLKYRGLDDVDVRGRFLALFAQQGVEPSRIELEGWSPHADTLAAYRRVDIALDTFPYSGCTTTCEALWMGVPVVTWAGETFAQRHFSHLAVVGVTETVARDPGHYAEIAVGLAIDLPRLADLRASLRPRMASSPLCDGERFARNLLLALRGAWRAWCAGPAS
jgi:predicted O-linked N-acetylglucosamine transferase (SPINDLY family)